MANLQFAFVVICFIAGAIQINGDDTDHQITGRLLTPQEGCGTPGGRSRRVKRVVGGSYAPNADWPWAVLLGFKRNGKFTGFMCAGSLITSRHVLSAAHCMHSDLNFVRLGEYDIRTQVDGEHIDVEIARWEQHNEWNPDLMINDIAMIRLVQDVTFNERVKPVCLPITPQLINLRFGGHYPFVIGWGNIYPKGGQQSPILKQVQVPVVDTNECREIYRSIGALKSDVQFSDGVICAGLIGGESTCHGDAGGPLQLPLGAQGVNHNVYYQIGVVSWGIGCGRANTPTVYTNVQHYADWIKSKLS